MALTPACSGEDLALHSRSRSQEIIYGEDDRQEAFAAELSSTQRRTLESTAAIIPWSRIHVDESGDVTVDAPTLARRLNVCSDERFADQVSAADCSAVLVEQDLLMTAGHCIAETTCSELALVFGFRYEADGVLRTLSRDDVYSCAEVEQHSFGSGGDYAIVRLERVVPEVPPARLRVGRLPLQSGAPLFIVGHPSGLPLKVAAGAHVADAREMERDYFTADLDSFPGNSGGGVFDEQTGELLGILVRGPNPGYVLDGSANCQRPEQASPDAPPRIESVYVHRLRDAHCAASPESTLCSCGDGFCAVDQLENSATCYEDCGSSCGDGECNGNESGNDCYADCGTCGNQLCEHDEVVRRSCPVDCGCRPGLTEQDGQCLPHLGNVNGDERINEADAVRLSAALVSPTVDIHARAGDMDCNAKLDHADLHALRSLIHAGEKLPCLQIASVALGSRHSCALSSSGQVRCWGAQGGGLLGTGPAAEATHGDSGAVAWAHRSRVVGSQRGDSLIDIPLTALPKVSLVSAGPSHSCALCEGGAVYCWGDGSLGQLGYGDRESIGDDEAAFSRGPVPLPEPAVSVAVGGTHSCAVLASGSMSCWGSNRFGQLGSGELGDIGAETTPQYREPITFPSQVERVALGFDHTCALLKTGALHCWGSNLFGQLGRASPLAGGPLEKAADTLPVDVGEPVVDLDAYQLFTCVTSAGGRAYCFGDNLSGQLGYGHRELIGDDEHPSEIGPLSLGGEVSSLRVGATHSCALLQDRSVKCWGGNLSSELGLGHSLPLPPEVLPSDLSPVEIGCPAAELFVGAHHSCVLCTSGALRCWGGNQSGQLGLGTFEDSQDVPESHEAVRLEAPDSPEWYFEDGGGVSVWAREASASSTSAQLTFVVRNERQTPIGDFGLVYSLDASEAPQAELSLMDLSTPLSTPVRTTANPGSTVRSILFAFEEGAILPGRSTRRSVERVEVRWSDPSLPFRWENDPGSVEKTLPRLFGPAEGYTLVGSAGEILYGWSRRAGNESDVAGP